MRRTLTAILFVVVLIGIDGVFNHYRFTLGLYDNVVEFGRVVKRTASGGL